MIITLIFALHKVPNQVVQTLKDLAIADSNDVLIHMGFTTCYSFAFFETCSDKIRESIKELPDDVRREVKINHLTKNLVPAAYFTTIYPYEIRIPYNILVENQIKPITKFFVYNKKTGVNGIPNAIIETEGVSSKNRLLQQLDYHSPGYGVWYQTSKSYTYKELFSAINFLHFSGNHPIPAWKKVSEFPLTLDTDSSEGTLRDTSDYKIKNHHKYDYEIYIFVKQNIPYTLPRIKLQPKENNKFKIIQLADLHFSTGYGKCQDVFPAIDYNNENCLADALTMDLITRVLDLETPDLVVLSGDQIYGDSSYDTESTIYKIVEKLINRRIPYAAVFGNHDDQNTISRAEQLAIFKTLPYSLSVTGPDDVDGVGNYLLSIGNEFDIYMLDSHSHLGPKIRGYDWFKESQIEYVSKVAAERPDTAKMAFFHIPLFEYREAHDLIGSYKEGVISAKQNTNMFPKLSQAGVKLMSVGHDHVNDYCFNHEGIELCYGGSCGYGGYAGYGGYVRRIRIFELDLNPRNRGNLIAKTWKRTHENVEEVIDLQELSL